MDEEPDSNCLVSSPLRPATIVLTSSEVKHQVDLQFSDVSYTVPSRKGKCKTILHNVSGEIRSGRLTAILGPSGAGKTTLLNLLGNRCSGKNQARFRNRLRLNGATIQEQPELFRRLSVCYVPQDFSLMPLLTVKETINIAARLKLSRRKIKDGVSRKFIIQDVAEKLGLHDCLDTLACNLSGGEKKRLSIAVEMISSPWLMLLDEPTSGLDSASSNQVMDMLSETARRGCTVVCSVHQPSSRMTCLFDDLLVMCRGRCCYCGPQDRILHHFKELGYACPPFYNLAEFVLEVVTGQRGGDYERISTSPADETRSITESSGPLEPSVRRYAVPRLMQTHVLLARAFVCVSRDPILTYLRLSAHIVVALLLGLLFYDFGQDASKVQSNIACIFFFPLFLFFASAMPAVQTFPTEAAVFLREKTNNWYSLESYYITKVLSDLPLQIICPTCFLTIAYYMTGQPLEFLRFFQVWLIGTLFTILAQSFGILTGIAFNTDAGVFLIPASNIPMVLFAGFFLKLGEIPVYLRFLSAISYFRFAFEGILNSIYLGRPKLPCHIDFCYFRKSERILGELDMPSMSFVEIIYGLFGWIVFLHSFIYALLSFKLKLAKRW